MYTLENYNYNCNYCKIQLQLITLTCSLHLIRHSVLFGNVFAFLCFLCCSILHARRHSSQQVCRHRITGQQLSEHPAADTGKFRPGNTQLVSVCAKETCLFGL